MQVFSKNLFSFKSVIPRHKTEHHKKNSINMFEHINKCVTLCV